MTKTVAILQSNYIPWKGYFDLIHRVDEFVLYDEVQYTRRDWRNRNRIKTPQGTTWLTIPVQVKGRYTQAIRETRVAGQDWRRKHWASLRHSYARTPHFDDYAPALEELYLGRWQEYLSEVNRAFLDFACGALGIDTTISWSTDHASRSSDKTERLVEICRSAGATTYLSGPAAREYLDEALFEAEGMSVAWMDYSGYRPYEQVYPPFEHAVTVLDLLFHQGPSSPAYMNSFPRGGEPG
jgi:hypothetical protein